MTRGLTNFKLCYSYQFYFADLRITYTATHKSCMQGFQSLSPVGVISILRHSPQPGVAPVLGLVVVTLTITSSVKLSCSSLSSSLDSAHTSTLAQRYGNTLEKEAAVGPRNT